MFFVCPEIYVKYIHASMQVSSCVYGYTYECKSFLTFWTHNNLRADWNLFRVATSNGTMGVVMYNHEYMDM